MKNDIFKVRHRNIGQPYTRHEYIRRIPQGKLGAMKWTYGDENKKFQYELQLISQNRKHLTANSLDAVRVAINHIMAGKKPTKEETAQKTVSKEEEDKKPLNFFFKILPYCHVILREHGLLGVAKAERLAKGMKKSFGKASSNCAVVNPNQIVILLRVNDLNLGKKAIDVASKKLKPSWKINVKTQSP